VAYACGCGDEPSGSIKCGESLEWLQDSAPWSKSLALVQVNMSSATDLLSVLAMMLAALASSCRHSVSSLFC
jgi:hypothetical protein